MKQLTYKQAFEILESNGEKFDRDYGYLEILDSQNVIYFEEPYELVEEEIENILYNCEMEQIGIILGYIDYDNAFEKLLNERNIVCLEDKYEEEDLLYVGAF